MVEQHFVYEVEEKHTGFNNFFLFLYFHLHLRYLDFLPLQFPYAPYKFKCGSAICTSLLRQRLLLNLLFVLLILLMSASDISISHVTSVCRLPSCSLLNVVWR